MIRFVTNLRPLVTPLETHIGVGYYVVVPVMAQSDRVL